MQSKKTLTSQIRSGTNIYNQPPAPLAPLGEYGVALLVTEGQDGEVDPLLGEGGPALAPHQPAGPRVVWPAWARFVAILKMVERPRDSSMLRWMVVVVQVHEQVVQVQVVQLVQVQVMHVMQVQEVQVHLRMVQEEVAGCQPRELHSRVCRARSA